MTGVVLDASALLTLLLNEPGAAKVKAVLARSSMTTVNLAEVVGHYARNGVPERDIRNVLAPLPIEYIAPDEALAYDMGLLLPITKPAGLSFGDRACLALARRLRATVLTADRQWQSVAGCLQSCI